MTTSSRVGGRRRWLWMTAAVLVVALGAVAAVWLWHSTRRGDTAHDDCTVVEQLAHQYIATKQSVTALQNGSGDTKDLLAAADIESAMADKIRAAEATVSAPAIKNELEQWAQGSALSAKVQRDSANQPQQPSDDADFVRAGTITYDATAALHSACPNMSASQ